MNTNVKQIKIISLIGGALALVWYGIVNVWYPYPLMSLLGGERLMWQGALGVFAFGVFAVSVFAKKGKNAKERAFDLSVVVFLQVIFLTFLGYIFFIDRPVALVFESDRFVAVRASEVNLSKFSSASKKFGNFSWTGPIVLGTRKPADYSEMMQSIMLSIKGLEPSARPDWWQSYASGVMDVKKRMRPIHQIEEKISLKSLSDLRKIEKEKAAFFYLPLVAHANLDSWIVLLDGSAKVVGYFPADGF